VTVLSNTVLILAVVFLPFQRLYQQISMVGLRCDQMSLGLDELICYLWNLEQLFNFSEPWICHL
jgi:hypothetical protein